MTAVSGGQLLRVAYAHELAIHKDADAVAEHLGLFHAVQQSTCQLISFRGFNSQAAWLESSAVEQARTCGSSR